MNTQHEQRCTHVAAHVYYLGKSIQLAWQEINLAISMALSELDHGKSAASAYESGANAIRTIASLHASPGQTSPI